jgi:periplasmic protein TonB
MYAIRRYGASAALAALVTLGLFFLMQALIASGGSGLEDEVRGRMIKMVRVERDETLQRKDVTARPPEQVKPPKLETPKAAAAGPGQNLYNFDLNLGREGLSGIGVGKGDGEYLPIVVVRPIYPQRAQAQGIEGYVLMRFTVAPDGSVVSDSVEVLESEPSGYFERAAIQSLLKSRYKPRVINGEAVSVPGVTRRIDFNLED